MPLIRFGFLVIFFFLFFFNFYVSLLSLTEGFCGSGQASLPFPLARVAEGGLSCTAAVMAKGMARWVQGTSQALEWRSCRQLCEDMSPEAQSLTQTRSYYSHFLGVWKVQLGKYFPPKIRISKQVKPDGWWLLIAVCKLINTVCLKQPPSLLENCRDGPTFQLFFPAL